MTLPPRNLLAEEASPYLRQHAGNPVHWRAWSLSALAEARELNRPILLSVGYAACHWCHVMAHESFEDADVAAVMNRLFVNIKVDREQRPDIDQIYMAALAAMSEQGGWPLTMFLTPAGKPFWGGTYFPPASRHGRPGFVQVMEAVDKAWREKQESLSQSADGLTAHITERLAGTSPGALLSLETSDALADGIHGLVDQDAGGLRGAPKFPNAPFIQTLWLSWLARGNELHRDAVLTSLEKMLSGGIYDHVGGGLSRYSTDAQWLVPHFEKMLYDNAQLLRLCNWAFAASGNELFRTRIEETVGWLLREMRVAGGAFAASLDADSDGEEGLYYTWTQDEIEHALGIEAALFSRYFSLASAPGWDGNPIIHQTARQQQQSLADSVRVVAIKQSLLTARARRVRPGRDDKVLADWNGLMIAALAECGRGLSRGDWVQAAAAAFTQVIKTSENSRLPHSMLGGSKLFPALSSDYAAMAGAAVSLFEATSDPSYITQAQALLEALDRWHLDAEGAGHYLTASDSTDVPIRIRGDVDEAIPSATGQIIEAMQRVATLTGDLGMEKRAIAVAEHAAGRMAHQAYGQAGIVNACALVIQPIKLVLIDDPTNPRLVPVATRSPDPRRVDIVVSVGSQTELPTLPGGALPPTDSAGAYLCTGQLCLPVIVDPVELETMLRPA